MPSTAALHMPMDRFPAAPRIQPVPAGIVTLDDHQRHAATVLDAAAWAYFAGTAADGHTHQSNQSAWQHIALLPRVLRTLGHGHTCTTLLGHSMETPLLLAPVAYQQLAHPDGEYATAHAAAASAVGMVLSTQSSVAVEHVANALQGSHAPLWFQLYLQPQRQHTCQLLRRAEAAGCQAIVLTVDAPVHGVRDAERRAGFALPATVRAVHLHDLQPPLPPAGTRPGLCQGLASTAPTWDDVSWLLEQTRLPVLLKGVLHPDDARAAQQAGVAGLIVSNHGGRTLDTLPATARMLPAIRAATGPGYPVLVDGGIRRGTDVFKALALGASAVLVGRPQVFGLANAGAMGVAHVLRLLRDELEACMTLCGCATLADITGQHLLA